MASRFGSGFKLFRDFLGFARENKAYWIVPLFLVLAAAAALVVVGQSAAPLIYTMF